MEIYNQSTKDGSFVLETFTDKYPAQVALIALQMKWTKLVQSALEKRSSDKNKSINEAKQEVAQIMKDLTEMCKLNLDPLKR
jgi:hypothetical protein